MPRTESEASKLSSELESPGLGAELDEEVVVVGCRKCGGREFRAKKGGLGRGSRVVCLKCGTAAE